uniref:Transmembrane and coiled-coil domain-containing protein 4 n=2 Tax=Acrobeloides nanus TaxID=290746 RepID=A0A914D6B5_9BILA
MVHPMVQISEADSPTKSIASSASTSSLSGSLNDKNSNHKHSRSFPTLAISRSFNNGITEPCTPTLPAPIKSMKELSGLLRPSTRFAFSNLIVTLLRLDFYSTTDKYSSDFTNLALEILLKCSNFPEGTNRSLRAHLEIEGVTEDVAALIISIKEDPYIQAHGPIVLMVAFLKAIIETADYDSRYRVLLRHTAALLGILWDDFEEAEDTLTLSIIDEQYVESDTSRLAREKNAKRKKIKRYAMIGAATGLGGVLIGLTGGLAAPLVAGAATAIGLGSAAVIGTVAGSAIFGSTLGVAGAGLTGYKMKRRAGAIEEFVIESLTNELSLHVVLCVNGWIDNEASYAFQEPWVGLQMSREQYTLRYESSYLLELGKAMEYFMTMGLSIAVQQTLMQTILHGILTSIMWPMALVSAASVIDNPWNVCTVRAKAVGEELAEVLLARAHGKRPITLIGFSLGARVIYHCLMTMSQRSDCVGIIEDVVLLGAPVSASPKQWKQIAKVVGGRIINGYCNSDWLLRFLYRTMSVQASIAGTGPVDNKDEKKIVNFNLSHIVKGHLDYSKKLMEVLDSVGVKIDKTSIKLSNEAEQGEEASELVEKIALDDSDNKISS